MTVKATGIQVKGSTDDWPKGQRHGGLRLFHFLAILAGAALLLPVMARRGVGAPSGLESGNKDHLVVLAYHEIAEPREAINPELAVSPSQFRAQLAWLQAEGYHFVSASQVRQALRSGLGLPRRPLLLTFDDGFSNVYSAAFPLLRQFHAPALLGLVGSWLETPSGPVVYGDQSIDRSRLLSWAQIRELERSGLVEAGSHSFNLHHGIPGNPQGDSEPALTTRAYTPGRGYESEIAYKQRLNLDLSRNSTLLLRRLGHRPRAIIWPYGRFNGTAERQAAALGMDLGFGLDDGANDRKVPSGGLRRVLMTAEMVGVPGLRNELALRRADANDTWRAVKAMHVDLDQIHDPNPSQTERNLALLLGRIDAMGVNTVYLQAFADPDGNGAADALYFPNRHLPLRDDLFNHVAWQIRTRTKVKRLYAWMPVLAFQLPVAEPAAGDLVVTLPSQNGHVPPGYPRLSPFSPRAMAVVADLYGDLAQRATFDGLLFHDDVILNDYEDGSPEALRRYASWGLPPDLVRLRTDRALLRRWTERRVETLDNLTLSLAARVRQDQPTLRTARNLYAQTVLNPNSVNWTSQSLPSALRQYDFTALEAMPFMEGAPDPDSFLRRLVAGVKEYPFGLRKVVFELQSTDWRTHQPIPTAVLANQITALYGLGARHIAYYPDSPFKNLPEPRLLRPVFVNHSSAPQM